MSKKTREQTHRKTHKPSTVTLAAHGRQRLTTPPLYTLGQNLQQCLKIVKPGAEHDHYVPQLLVNTSTSSEQRLHVHKTRDVRFALWVVDIRI